MIHDGDEDELDVGFEPGALDEELPGATDVIGDAKSSQALVDDVPDDLDEGDAEAADEDEVAGEDESVETDETHVRLQAAEERALRAEIRGIQDSGHAAIAYAEQQMNASKVALDSLDDKINAATIALAQAREAGDTARELNIERSIRDMDSLKAEINKARSEMPTREQIIAHTEQQVREHLGRARQQSPRGKVVGEGIQANTPLAEKWAASNGWMKTNKAANEYVVKQSKAMVAENWDMNTPGFYAELTRRTSRAFPGLKVSALQASKTGIAKAGVKTPVAPARSSSGGAVKRAPATNLKSYKLTSVDVAAMRRMRLDPHDPLARKEFARSRIESARRAQ